MTPAEGARTMIHEVKFQIEQLPSGLYQAFATAKGKRQNLGDPVASRQEAKDICDVSQAEFLERVKRVKKEAGQQVTVTTFGNIHPN